jgi:tRNA U34 5-methylaminomethyl-2-thiouridine-forming methyltransferase MnmC
LATPDKNRLILKPNESFNLKREIRITEDGSSTIFLPELNENYHSIHGAIQESMHVFIEAGLKQIPKKELSVFEVGFGTGLNCFLSFLYAEGKKIAYHAIEKFPVEDSLLSGLNYTNAFNDEALSIFNEIHKIPWNAEVSITTDFSLLKIVGDINSYLPKSSYNLIYFDAFAPEVQPELWTLEVFQKMYAMLIPDGILVTYCAKGEVRRTMQSCGFSVERIPGPPGKREMLRARKS